ncbi:N-acetylneuraminate synthase [Halovenus sp. HT40]|uniref:N-acetylneuraminate synthase n=1 Tax=Halovenus sp. HT40 TaxID=3126691 RepID=UPI00300F5A7D
MNRIGRSEQQACEVIAEAGINHNGDLGTAKRLVDAAADAGADTVKFQTFQTEEIVTRDTERAGYQKRAGDSSQYEMLEAVELQKSDHFALQEYCQNRGIEFLSTPYDPGSVSLLEELDVDRYKIASADIINKPLLKSVADTGKPVILSTGMASLGEIERAVEFLQTHGCDSVVLMYCVSCYPATPDDIDMQCIDTLRRTFGVPVGFSDHTRGTSVPIIAAGNGASVIEKHFTLDRSMEGPDHEASLEPSELERMVNGIRTATAVEGDGTIKQPPCERENRPQMRRSLHVCRDISAGAELAEDDLIVVRPDDGISPWKIDDVVGCTTKRDLKAQESVTWNDIRKRAV